MTRENSATVGATDGNIIAAIITTQTPRNQPTLPRPVHGPASMPRISRAAHAQPTPATTKSPATSPSRARAAAYTGPRPARVWVVTGVATRHAAQENSEVDKPVLPS